MSACPVRRWGSWQAQLLSEVCRNIAQQGGLVIGANVERPWRRGLSQEVNRGTSRVISVDPVGPPVGVRDFTPPDLIDETGGAPSVQSGQTKDRSVAHP